MNLKKMTGESVNFNFNANALETGVQKISMYQHSKP
jgi:hypothetical protein